MATKWEPGSLTFLAAANDAPDPEAAKAAAVKQFKKEAQDVPNKAVENRGLGEDATPLTQEFETDCVAGVGGFELPEDDSSNSRDAEFSACAISSRFL